ncbi:MAG: hypothetical protein QOK37_4613 [Thermoanaerobaculia bacterium]|jgi:hypothetical protein|nr:hypothetical protein [Thermoanaerobaculia bacterium]
MKSRRRAIFLSTIVFLLGVITLVLWVFWRLPAPISALLAGAIGFLISKVVESWKESRERLHDKKREVYAKLLAPMLALQLQMLKGGDRPAHEVVLTEMSAQMVTATFDAVLYASDEVLKLWGRIRTAGLTGEQILVLYMRLLKAIRKDVGNTYTSINEADILRLFVNFSDEDLAKYLLLSAQTPV